MGETFRCRHLLPVTAIWKEVQAEDFVDAVQEHAFRHPHREPSLLFSGVDSTGRKCSFVFSVVEAEGYGSSITRVMHYGLSRRGGLPSLSSLPERLQEIADRIGWGDRPLEEMIGPWDREESYEEATYRERVESERRARSLSSHTYGGSRGEEQA